MTTVMKRLTKGVVLKGEATDVTENLEGSLWQNSATTRMKTYIEAAVREVVTNTQAQTLTNKTIDADLNIITNIKNADIKAGAAIDLTKLANGALPSGITIASANIVDGTIVDADVSASAAIALSKLATGALPSGITIASANIVDGTIVDADISASAAIALSKLATGALPTAITIASANIVDGTIVDADISASAAIALSKLATGALPTAITIASANIVDGTIVDADISASAAISASKIAMPVSVSISALDIDWTLGNVYYKDIAENSTFTFTNVTDGKTISVILTNTSAATISITLPATIYRVAGALTIAAGEGAVYTFMRANSKTYMASVSSIVVV